MKRLILYIAFSGLQTLVLGQVTDYEFQAELESMIEAAVAEEENADVEQLTEELQLIRERPININQATREDFERLYFLSGLQIDNLLDYRKKYGQIYSPFELNSIDGFNPDLIRVLQAFMLFGESDEKPFRFRPRQEVMLRAIRLLEKQKGYKEPRKYIGSPEKLYLRYRYSEPSLHAGLTAEKDAGESFFNEANPVGFDYYSGYVNFDFQDGKHRLYLGDYLVRFGQGLTAWQGFSLSKSAEVGGVAKFNQGIKSYSSTDENNFLRGVATRLDLGKFQWSSFVSYKKFDANKDSIDGDAVFTSFQTSGLHRSQNEIDDKNSVRAFTAGTNLSFSFDKLSIGLTGIHFRYELPLQRKRADYNLFLFDGRQVSNLGLSYKYGLNRYFFFGETAWSSTRGTAFIQGVQANPADQIALSLLYRNIGKNYNTPLAGAFTEGSKVNDEQGVYFGAVVQPIAGVSLRMYADFFRYNWIKYATVAPGKGQEYLLQLDYRVNQDWKVYSRYFLEKKPVKSNGNFTKLNLEQSREKVRIQVEGVLWRQFILKSRWECIWYQHEQKSFGWMVFQDVGFHSESNSQAWWLRLAYFHTDDYDSRVYAFENDLLYQFSVPAFYGEGIRIYANGKVKICEKVDVWVKVARSWFLGLDKLGSGYSQIDGGKKTEVKFQLRFKF
ncbi:helix-hairpin-helix domain-containing protein [uncultured Sunxiuqinia sp.]|uniref:ComEA family DNA-binding protein n=1 Tax=uncultured Sunxiuqinia sp. TaxID=1573825 RepID=UPI002AA93A60|nr:helix-hairpin-helix domain-containing protein [uncultured Sunxiuqinia sp.]